MQAISFTQKNDILHFKKHPPIPRVIPILILGLKVKEALAVAQVIFSKSTCSRQEGKGEDTDEPQ